MELELTDEQLELQSSVSAFLSRECPIRLVRELVETGATDGVDRLWKQMIDLGWPALTVPEEYGGLGLGFVELAVVCAELGRVVAPGPFLPTATQFAAAIREAGDDVQRQRFLSAVASGQLTGTLAAAGEGGDWEVANPAQAPVTARPSRGGWVLDGTCHWVIEGDRADELVVAAHVERGDGVGLFVVPGDDVGAAPLTALDASRGLNSVRLDDVFVDRARTLGDPGQCSLPLRRILEEATVALAFEVVGTCQAIFDIALDHAKHREQFGVPIGSFQAIKHKFADMLVALERARATGWFAALTIAEDDERRTLATAVAKATAGDCQRLLCQEGIQILGGIGYTWEHDMHLYVKRAKSGDALFGTSAVHRARVADILGL